MATTSSQVHKIAALPTKKVTTTTHVSHTHCDQEPAGNLELAMKTLRAIFNKYPALTLNYVNRHADHDAWFKNRYAREIEKLATAGLSQHELFQLSRQHQYIAVVWAQHLHVLSSYGISPQYVLNTDKKNREILLNLAHYYDHFHFSTDYMNKAAERMPLNTPLYYWQRQDITQALRRLQPEIKFDEQMKENLHRYPNATLLSALLAKAELDSQDATIPSDRLGFILRHYSIICELLRQGWSAHKVLTSDNNTFAEGCFGSQALKSALEIGITPDYFVSSDVSATDCEKALALAHFVQYELGLRSFRPQPLEFGDIYQLLHQKRQAKQIKTALESDNVKDINENISACIKNTVEPITTMKESREDRTARPLRLDLPADNTQETADSPRSSFPQGEAAHP